MIYIAYTCDTISRGEMVTRRCRHLPGGLVEGRMGQDRWLTVAQVAAMVQVHPETIREWLRAGRLPGTLLSRRAGWRIRQRDAERLLAGELETFGGKATAAE